jgi:hypothetical protein
MRFTAAVTIFASLVSACSAGKQTLAWEMPADEYLPWFGGPAYYARWTHGPPDDPSFFPLMVWMQNPSNAVRFRDVGINVFAGLWEGPTEEQLTALTAADMPAICAQEGVWEAHLAESTIQGWMQPDQPDGAQLQADGTYGPCIEPSVIIESYDNMHALDPTRPVFMNLSRGVADPDWEGRGACSGRIDMYPDYARGADVLTLINYPVNAGDPLETTATGIDNLKRFANDEKPVTAAVEASDIDGVMQPTPLQIKAQVWISLVHGAMGIQYYCHRLAPTVNETHCLDDIPTRDALAAINEQVKGLAPVLNTPSIAAGVKATSSTPGGVIDTMLKRVDGVTYLFAVSARNIGTTAEFAVTSVSKMTRAEVLDESRTIPVTDGTFSDAFDPYEVHLYRMAD